MPARRTGCPIEMPSRSGLSAINWHDRDGRPGCKPAAKRSAGFRGTTFATEADRDTYLPHPAHKEFVALVGPHVDKVCVVDYWTRD